MSAIAGAYLMLADERNRREALEAANKQPRKGPDPTNALLLLALLAILVLVVLTT